jgi:signal transduction histidine kinase
MLPRKKIWLWFSIGFGIGFLVVHPLIMVIAKVMDVNMPLHFASIRTAVLMGFTYAMLPWGLGLALLSGIVAALITKVQQIRVEKSKLQGVMALAGAACHELNQPMQVILGYADLIGRELPPEDPLAPVLKEIGSQISRMDVILKKIRSITRYETFEYLDEIHLIDIHKASERNDVGKQKIRK